MIISASPHPKRSQTNAAPRTVGLERGQHQKDEAANWDGLFAFLSQDGSGTRIHVMDLAACRTGHRLIYVVVLRNIFGRKALNAIPGFRAAVHEERHLKIHSRSTSQNGLI